MPGHSQAAIPESCCGFSGSSPSALPATGVPHPYCAGRAAYWRAMCMRSSASESSVSFPLTSTVTLSMVPVNLNGLA